MYKATMSNFDWNGFYEWIHRHWPWPTASNNLTISHKDILYCSIALIWLGGGLIWLVFAARRSKCKGKVTPGLVIAALLVAAFFILLAVEPAAITIWPYNISASLAAKDAPPFVAPDQYFPQHTIFEDPAVFQRIQQELDAIPNLPAITDALRAQQYIGGEDRGWKLLPIKLMGHVIPANAAKVPYLMSLVEQCPEIVTVMYSVIDGGKHIPIHTGYFKGIIRYHLGIHVPESDKVWIEVHKQKYHWREGEGVMFDDKFPHEVFHQGRLSRAVLWFDIKREFKQQWLNRWTDRQLEQVSNSTFITSLNKKSETQYNIDPQ